jgi:Eukaryotic aspartyl protease
MQSQGKLTSKVFALYLADSSVQSSLQIGDYDTAYLRDPTTPISFIPLVDKTIFWDVKVDAVRVGISNFASDMTPMGWTLSGSIACLDSGTSIAYIPRTLFPSFINSVMHGKRYQVFDDLYYSQSCDLYEYESVFLLIGGVNFEIPPEIYVEQLPSSSYCLIHFSTNVDDWWLLGDTFLRNYYSIWDHDGNRIGLAPHKTSSARVLSLDELPQPPTAFTNGETAVQINDIIMIALSTAAIISATALGAYLLYNLFSNLGVFGIV